MDTPQNPTPNDAPWLKPAAPSPAQPTAPAATPPTPLALKPPMLPVPPVPPTQPPKPPSPPPAPSMPPPSKPAATTKPPRESSGLWWKILVALAILLALGVLGYSLYIGSTTKPSPSIIPEQSTTTTPTNTTTSTPGTSTTSTTSTNPADNTYGFNREDIYPFGKAVTLFGPDNDLFKGRSLALGVKVLGFNDTTSVHLLVTDELSGATQDITLGINGPKIVQVFNATFTLGELDDGKGGTYATITVQ